MVKPDRPHKSYVETRRGLIHVQQSGDGPTAVVLLSITSYGGVLVDQALPLLARCGYRALALDLMGYGRSDKRDGHWLVDDFSDNIEDAFDRLDVSPAALVCGHFSGWMGLQLANRRPGLRALVLDGTPFIDAAQRELARRQPPAPPVAWTEDGAHAMVYWKRIYGMLRTLDPSLALGAAPSPKFREAVIALMETLCFEPGTSAAANAFDIEDHLGRLHTPTLVLCSDHDWNLKHHDRLVAAIGHARSRRFAGAHPLHALDHPERAHEYVDAIDAFLRDVLAADRGGPHPLLLA